MDKGKTDYQLLHVLPNHLRNRVVRIIQKQNKIYGSRSTLHCVNGFGFLGMFYWVETREGDDYWANVYNTHYTEQWDKITSYEND
jgi:hypothetical protein